MNVSSKLGGKAFASAQSRIRPWDVQRVYGGPGLELVLALASRIAGSIQIWCVVDGSRSGSN